MNIESTERSIMAQFKMLKDEYRDIASAIMATHTGCVL